jgi:MmoB/DmpM family
VAASGAVESSIRASAANRLARPQTRAKVISTYFVFAYAGLSIPASASASASHRTTSAASGPCSAVPSCLPRCACSRPPSAQERPALYLRSWGIFRGPYCKIERDGELDFDMTKLGERLGRDIDTDTFLISMSSYYGRIVVSDHHVTIHPEILPDRFRS